jgi:KTSC domain
MTIRAIDPQIATQLPSGCIKCKRDWPNAHFSREAEAIARGELPAHICDLCLEFAPASDEIAQAIDEAQAPTSFDTLLRTVMVTGIQSKSHLHAFEYVTHRDGKAMAFTDVDVEFYNPDIPKSSRYIFRAVPVAVCEAWYAAPSKGSYFAEQIKSSYSCEKLK